MNHSTIAIKTGIPWGTRAKKVGGSRVSGGLPAENLGGSRVLGGRDFRREPAIYGEYSRAGRAGFE